MQTKNDLAIIKYAQKIKNAKVYITNSCILVHNTMKRSSLRKNMQMYINPLPDYHIKQWDQQVL